MGLTNLFNGIAVVIDDEIGEEHANINNLIDQIKNRNMPCLEYKEIPDESIIDRFEGVSFVLLDWEIKTEEYKKSMPEGVRYPDTLTESQINENIDFLKKLKDKCFAPVFIFTNWNIDVVTRTLEDNGLYQVNKPNYIFINKKDDLIGRTKLFRKIEEWVNKTPSVYVLEIWKNEYQKAKTKLFHEFYEINPSWPKILWKNFSEDGMNMSQELGDVITHNLHTRMSPFSFDDALLGKRGKKVQRGEIRNLLEGERFIRKIDGTTLSTGDVFKVEYQNEGGTKFSYYLNIRPQCDLVRDSNLDNVELYCLKGRVFDENNINKKDGVPFIEGQFIEKINHAIIPFIDDNKIIEFLFRDMKIKKFKALKNKRIGRLLPPYITRIQQRYALYLTRQGLPRIPKEAISK